MVMAESIMQPQACKGRKCRVCRRQFVPHPRLGNRQQTCGSEKCRRVHRASYRRKYRSINSEAESGYEAKRKAARPKDYWKQYRDRHLESTTRNRAQSRLRKQLRRAGLQRQLDIVQLIDPIEKLETVVRFATSHRSLLEECLIKPTG
jgi:hypothetical protein